MTATAIYAAGAVCWRLIDEKIHILVIHRTRYADVTLPKGKVNPGETLPQAAVREVQEETGMSLRLGVPLGVTCYVISSGREKFVHYWAAEVSEKAVAASTFVPNGEVAALEWITIKKARKYLSYERDVELLDSFAALVDEGVTRTFAIIALRHGKAIAPSSWDGPDATRPLTERGVRQAAGNVHTMAAWRPQKLVTSTAVRCVATVAPLAAAWGLHPDKEPGISQDSYENGAATVREVVGKRVRKLKTAVLCSHGPVLPEILREIALATGTTMGSYIREAAALETGGFSVVHLSATNPASGIISIETYSPRA